MNAPPVLRPLRAILQRRLQLVPSRPIRTTLYYARASQLRPQFRCNSSTTKDPAEKSDSPAEEAAKESSPDTPAAAPTNAAQEAQDVNPEEHLEPPERPQNTTGEIEVQQAEPTEFAVVQPGEPVTDAEVAVPDQSSSNEAAPPKLDAALVKSAFQKVRLAGAEVEAGISEVVARQIEAAEAATAPGPGRIVIPGSDGTFTLSETEEAEIIKAFVQARFESEQLQRTTADSADSAPHGVSAAAETEEVLGEPQSRGQEAVEAASVASQSRAPEAVTEQDTPEPAVEAQSEPVETAETPAALPDEVIKAAEEVRETEEVGGGETDISEPVVLTNTEAQDIVNEQIAAAELDPTPPQEEPASPAAAADKEAAESKHDSLSAAAEEELGDRAEERAAELVETFEEDEEDPEEGPRLPRNVQAFYLQPLRRVAEHNMPTCNLQLRSYSVRPLESFCDFALRAAYYLGLPAYGPTPLPRIIQRWTVPKSSFIFKKSQENFERITRRRLIQIRDGHPHTVQVWLAFLQKHQQAAVGMKANIWEFSSIDVAKELDQAYEEAKPLIEEKFKLFGQDKEIGTVEKVDELLTSERYKLAGGR